MAPEWVQGLALVTAAALMLAWALAEERHL